MVKRTHTPIPPATETLPVLMLITEVATELRKTPKAVRAMIYAGKLKAYYVGGRSLRVKRVDFDKFLATEMKPA